MKQQIEQLIEKLSDKSLTFGCRVGYTGGGEEIKYYGKVSRVVKWEQDELRYIIYYDESNNSEDFEAFRSKKSLESNYKILGHPILIGDVLERMDEGAHEEAIEILYHQKDILKLCFLWSKCGLTKSLQEIYSECEWIAEDPNDSLNVVAYLIIPKQKAHRELFLFLLSLNL